MLVSLLLSSSLGFRIAVTEEDMEEGKEEEEEERGKETESQELTSCR